MNTSNCKTCVYKQHAPTNAHCYMFKKEPAIRCMQWKADAFAMRTPVRRISLERAP